MDLEYFHSRQQVSELMSENAACDSSRIVHRKMANAYALLITNAKIAATEAHRSGEREHMVPVQPPLPARRRRSFKLPADTAAGCRDRAAADLLASVAMSAGNGRQRLETSAASWAARAELLQRDEDDFETRRNLRV